MVTIFCIIALFIIFCIGLFVFKLYFSVNKKAPLDGKYLEVDGFKVFYIERGEKNPKKLVLVHGYNSSHYCFVKNIEELSKEYHVIVPDLVGFGFSDKPLKNFVYTFKSVGDILYRFLQKKGFDEIYYAGNSMGGGLGLSLATDYPSMFKKLVLLAPANPYDPESIDFFEQLKSNFLFFIFLIIDNVFFSKRLYESKIFNNYKISFKEINKLMAHKWTKNYRRSSRRTLFDGGLEEILALDKKVALIKCPVLLIYGDHDNVLSPDKQKVLASHLKDCKEIVYENCGHMPHYERADDFHNDLNKFINQ